MKITNLNQSPYLVSYTPQSSPNGTVYVTSVEDMIVYNISSSFTSSLNYAVGAFDSYSFNFIVKNVTTNTNLNVNLELTPYFTTPSASVTLLPLEQKNIPISLSRAGIENQAEIVNTPFSIKINTTNQLGLVSLRSTTTTLPSQSTLPPIIQIR
jgi:hypothetical protein